MNVNMLNGFEEFQNTSACKKAERREPDAILSVHVTKGYKGKLGVNIFLSKGLVDLMKEKKLTRFKFLYNEKENAIAIRYDNSSNCYDLDNYTISRAGAIQIRDKYITITMLDRFEKDNVVGYKFAGKYFELGSCIVLRVSSKTRQ